MKKLILFAVLLLSGYFLSTAQTAVNFSANDCDGTTHDLYSELDQGKVVILDFVMPCTSCIAPSLTAYNISASYEASYPGKIAFYLLDDQANTNCTTLTNWGINNVGSEFTSFSDAAAVESLYGTGGMPKIVIVAGPEHKIYFNENGAAAGVVSDLQDALDSALTAVTAIKEIVNNTFSLKLSPAVTSGSLSVEYAIPQAAAVKMQIFSIVGEKVKTISSEFESAGTHQLQLELGNLRNGIYFLKLESGQQVKIERFSISH